MREEDIILAQICVLKPHSNYCRSMYGVREGFVGLVPIKRGKANNLFKFWKNLIFPANFKV